MHASLAEICKDLHCILRFYKFKNLPGPRRGRELEKVFEDYCLSKSLKLVDRRGSKTLFGHKSLSGIDHEVDGSIDFENWKLYVELKACERHVPKDQVMLFHDKSLDYFLAFVKSKKKGHSFYRAFVTDSPLGEIPRRFCHLWSIITVEPHRLPIPVILEYLRTEKWKQFFEFTILQGVERVLARCSLPLDKILVRVRDPLPSIGIRESTLLSAKELDEIEEIHSFVSDELLEAIEEEDPEHFERHTEKLLCHAGLII